MKQSLKLAIVAALAAGIVATLMVRERVKRAGAAERAAAGAASPGGLPRLVDLGAGKCIPCKAMAPILEELKVSLAGKIAVEFIDVWENEDAGKKYGIETIPTQIFYDAAGKELFRHVGFLSKEDILAKWKELGVDLAAPPAVPGVSRWAPAQSDTRPKESLCYLCDESIPSNGMVVVKTEKGDVRLCGMHHYLVMYSCLTGDTTGFESKVSVADHATGAQTPIAAAAYVYGMAPAGRPTVAAFADRAAAEVHRQAAGGTVVDLAVLQGKELAHRCGFCDRAVYPEDVAEVVAADVRTWGCCSHCALGVAARTGQDIEVRERDRLTGAPVVVKTLNGSVASIEPPTAVAWFGQRTKPDGSRVSAGCFHQGFFTSAATLAQWVEANPLETGEQITIHRALADKMKLTPQQISKACKIGECSPK
ncbi:MAG: hypothetical protein KJ579_07115 [Verrucomicrobia bacterium]|nr:hypothetical protein [Verrucomicrobiota bacterium]